MASDVEESIHDDVSSLDEQSPLIRRPSDDTSTLPKELSTRELLYVMSGVWFGGFFAAVDITLIAALAVPISDSFGSDELISWLASAYFVANGALQPLAGKLTDIFSRRTGLLLSNLSFAAGNLVCGLATTKWAIILGRVVAGAGGGCLLIISQFVTSDLVPLRRRGMWSGFSNITYGVGAAVGGAAGGWISDRWGWRWAFLVQLPFTAIALIAVWFTVHIPAATPNRSKYRTIDYAGALSLTIAIVLFLLGITSGGSIVQWSHPLVWISLSTSMIVFVIFVFVEAKIATEPIIPLRLLLNRTPAVACLVNWLSPMSHFGLLFYAPLYFQLQGSTATKAGVQLIPSSLGICAGSILAGYIMRRTGKYYFLNICIGIIFVLSYALNATFEIRTPSWQPALALIMSGLAYSGILTVVLLALIAAVDHENQAVMTSASYAFRSTGSSVGLAIASAVFHNVVRTELRDRLGDRDGINDKLLEVTSGLAAIKAMYPDDQDTVEEVFMDGLRGVFFSLLGAAIATLLACFFLREHKLHTNLARK